MGGRFKKLSSLIGIFLFVLLIACQNGKSGSDNSPVDLTVQVDLPQTLVNYSLLSEKYADQFMNSSAEALEFNVSRVDLTITGPQITGSLNESLYPEGSIATGRLKVPAGRLLVQASLVNSASQPVMYLAGVQEVSGKQAQINLTLKESPTYLPIIQGNFIRFWLNPQEVKSALAQVSQPELLDVSKLKQAGGAAFFHAMIDDILGVQNVELGNARPYLRGGFRASAVKRFIRNGINGEIAKDLKAENFKRYLPSSYLISTGSVTRQIFLKYQTAGTLRNVQDLILEADQYSGAAPLTVAFNAAVNSENAADLSYYWDFNNDGVTDSNSASPIYSYTEGGDYQAQLKIRDHSGNWSETYAKIRVYPVPNPNWTKPIVVSSNLTANHISTLAVDQSGNIHAIWEANQQNLFYARYDKNLQQVVAPQVIHYSSLALRRVTVRLATGSSMLHLVWQEGRNVNYAIMNPDNYRDRISPTTVATVNLAQYEWQLFGLGYNSMVLDKKNQPHIAWFDQTKDTSGNIVGQIHYTVYQGNRWVDEVVATSTGRKLIDPALVLDSSETPHLVWTDFIHAMDTTDKILYYSSRGDSGWKAPQRLLNTLQVLTCDLTIDPQNTVYVCGMAGANISQLEDSRLYYTRKSATGDWTAPAQVSPSRSLFYMLFPNMVSDAQGNIHMNCMGWYPEEDDLFNCDTYYVKFDAIAQSWQSPEQVLHWPAAQTLPSRDIALDPLSGQPIFIWQENSGNITNIYLSRRLP